MVAASSRLLPDIVIGDNASVGAASVVIEHVPPNRVVAGDSAEVIKDICDLKCPYGLIGKPYEI